MHRMQKNLTYISNAIWQIISNDHYTGSIIGHGKSLKQHLPEGLLVEHEHVWRLVCWITKSFVDGLSSAVLRLTPKQ
jgi:hypothetical protein